MMKRELTAAAVLVMLIAASIWNISRIDTLCGEIGIAICKSRAATEQLNFKDSRKLADEGLEIWQENQGYARVFLSQAQVDNTTQTFQRLMEALSKEDVPSIAPAYDALLEQLDSLQMEERPSVGSIF